MIKSTKNGEEFYNNLSAKRNDRGFLPREMVHYTDTDEFEPDYVFVVNKERSEILIN